jgi:hypothetical protein|tara:strand:+ start:283 stop:795 length:513 start_codon:yes stop_codon:yes gene_type:complete
MVAYSVHDLADEIFANEFEYDSGYAQFYYISGWLANNVGLLNTKIYSQYSVQNSNFEPTGLFQQEERSIYKQMYLYEFYTKKTRQVLRGVDSSVDFVTLREGDTMITRTNKNELAKTYRGLANDAREEMERLVSSYNIYQAAPVQVAGEDGSPIFTGSGYFYYPYGYGNP